MKNNFFEFTPDPFCIIGTDGNFLEINPAFLKTLGYSIKDIISTPFLDIVHPNDKEKTQEAFFKDLSVNEVNNFQNQIKHKNGCFKTLSWSILTDSQDNIIYATARDITDHKLTEAKLLEVNRTLLDYSIIAITDKNGVITHVNDRFCNISGYSKKELVGNTHQIVNSNTHSKGFWEEMWKTILSGKTWTGYIENLSKSGSHYYLYSVIIPQRNSQGEIESFMAIRYEVTREVLLHKSLSKTLQILNDTNSIARIGGWELIVDSGELNWTDETFNILEVEKLNGQKPLLPQGLELFIPEHKPIIEKAVQMAIECGEPYSLELMALTAKKNKIWVFTNGKPHYENGKVTRLTGTIQDIHSRKVTELNLEQERSKSLQNSKLANLGELAAGIAHEINNSLSVISGNTKLLPQSLHDTDKFEHRVAIIEKSCRKIGSITKNLVKFSRKSNDSEMLPVFINTLLEEVVVLAELKAKQFNTKITVCSDLNEKILCNEIEIEQVFINLINNSIDAIKEQDERWVRVEVSLVDNKVVVKVVDSGMTMTKEKAELMFEPFFTSKSIGEGTGLGLSISKGIIEKHEASIFIDLESKNTCFTVIFSSYNEDN